MADYRNLSKEELIDMILNEKKDTPSKEKCKFVPLRGAASRCDNDQDHPWGFCKKHAKSVQASRAFEEYTKNQVMNSMKEKVVEETPPSHSMSSNSKSSQSSRSSSSHSKSEDKVVKRKRPPPPKQKQFTVVKNKWGNYVHEKTLIVVDFKTKKAVGIQAPSGQILPLTIEKIKVCERYGIPYVVMEESSDEELSDDYDEEESAGEDIDDDEVDEDDFDESATGDDSDIDDDSEEDDEDGSEEDSDDYDESNDCYSDDYDDEDDYESAGEDDY